MKIIIAGAGSVGYHLAKLLSRENQDISIIDSDDDVLDMINDNSYEVELVDDSEIPVAED